MEAEVTHATAEAPRGVEGTPRVVGEAGWRRVARWVADYELVLILVPVGAVILVNQLPLRWVLGSLVVIPFTWAARWIARGRLTMSIPLNTPILMLMLMTGVALYPSVDLTVTLSALAIMIAGLGLFYAIVNTVHSERSLWLLAWLVPVVGVGIAAMSLVNTGWVTGKLFAAPNIYNRLPHLLDILNPAGFNRNIVGGTLAMLFPLCLALTLGGPHHDNHKGGSSPSSRLTPGTLRLLAGTATVVVGGTLVLTQSRGALAGATVAFLILGVWWSRITLLLVPVGAIGFSMAIQKFGLQAVVDFFLITDITPSAQGRFELWQRAIYMLQDFPYTGTGLGTFSRVMPVLYPTFLIGPDTVVPHAHNLYLQTGVDLGLPGLVAYVGSVVAFLLIGASAIRHTRGTPLQAVAVGGVGGFVAYLIHGLVDNVTFSAKPAMVLWALMGLTTTVWLLRANHSRRLEGDRNANAFD